LGSVEKFRLAIFGFGATPFEALRVSFILVVIANFILAVLSSIISGRHCERNEVERSNPLNLTLSLLRSSVGAFPQEIAFLRFTQDRLLNDGFKALTSHVSRFTAHVLSTSGTPAGSSASALLF
jgi:hypothetical protein